MEALHRLAQIRTLRFVARSESGSGWNGAGLGSVVVARPEKSTMTFTEAGTWKPDVGKEVNFNNVFRWSFDDSVHSIRLEHLRRGPNDPVYLFDLTSANEETWQSITPYVCQDDLYSARMIIKPDQVELRWTVKGPRKNEDIHYWYT